jgi:haloacetate dehalogenase
MSLSTLALTTVEREQLTDYVWITQRQSAKSASWTLCRLCACTRDTSKEFATKYMWWFFLIQEAPLPEHMIGADAEFFLDYNLQVLNGTPGALTTAAVNEYRRCFCIPEAIHASCEDFRAAAGIDLEMDEADESAGHKIQAPVLALWGAKNVVGKLWNLLEVWRQHANAPVEGRPLDSGHFLAEEQPEEVLQEFLRFFRD